jgi:predicted SAM-dependent methyltransferase
MIKLNLGCGTKIIEGFKNIDIRDNPGVDIILDLKKPLPFHNDSVDFILAEDVLEHFSFKLTDVIFSDWVRVLKPDCKIKLILPDIDKHIDFYINQKHERRKGKNKIVDIYRLRHLLFGGQDYEYSYHYTTFNKQAIVELFSKHGVKIIEYIDLQKGIDVTGQKIRKYKDD